MTISDLDRAVARLSSPLRSLEQTIKSSLDPFCSKYKYPMVSRVKSAESVAQKIETGRYKKILDIDDLVAFTIIIPTGSHESRCLDFLNATFAVSYTRNRSHSSKNPKQFTFDSTRLYARRKCPVWEEDKENIGYRLLFEVQIQTALEHAWIVATHDVVYKSGTIDWQKVRLAAQTKAQIEIIDVIFNKFEYFSQSLDPYGWKEGEQIAQVISFFTGLSESGTIPREIIPNDRVRLAEKALKILSKSSMSNLTQTLDAMCEVFKQLSTEGFPQNLTLFQAFLLAATRAGKNGAASDRFVPHITESFERMFPEVKTWGSRFIYELTEDAPIGVPLNLMQKPNLESGG